MEVQKQALPSAEEASELADLKKALKEAKKVAEHAQGEALAVKAELQSMYETLSPSKGSERKGVNMQEEVTTIWAAQNKAKAELQEEVTALKEELQGTRAQVAVQLHELEGGKAKAEALEMAAQVSQMQLEGNLQTAEQDKEKLRQALSRAQKAETEVGIIGAELLASGSAILALRRELRTQQEQLSAAHSEITQLNTEASALKAHGAIDQVKVERSQFNEMEARGAIASLEMQLRQSEQERIALETQLRQVESEHAAVKREIQTWEDKAKVAERQASQARRQASESRMGLSTQREKETDELDSMRKSMLKATREINSLTKAKASLEAQLAAVKSTQQRQTKNMASESVAGLARHAGSQEISSHQTREAQKLESQLKESRRAVKERDAQIKAMEEQLEIAARKMAKATATVRQVVRSRTIGDDNPAQPVAFKETENLASRRQTTRGKLTGSDGKDGGFWDVRSAVMRLGDVNEDSTGKSPADRIRMSGTVGAAHALRTPEKGNNASASMSSTYTPLSRAELQSLGAYEGALTPSPSARTRENGSQREKAVDLRAKVHRSKAAKWTPTTPKPSPSYSPSRTDGEDPLLGF